MWRKYRLNYVLKQLNLNNIYVYIFKRIEFTPAGNFAIHIRLGTGTSPTKIQKKIEQIAIGMKMEEAILVRVKRHKFKLVFRNRSENTFPEYPRDISSPDIQQQKIMYLPLGKDADGYQVRFPIFTPSGGTVSLIGGLPGQGKSSALKVLVSGLANSDDCIIWFDAKSGADANAYQNRVNVFTDPINPEPYAKVLKFILRSAEIRNQISSRGGNLNNLPRIVLIVDEWYLLSAIGTKVAQNDIQTDLRKIVSIGRSANISVILATQRPTSQNIDVTTRELCNTRIAFYCGDIHASEAILGQTGAEDKNNPLRQGEALIWINGYLQRTTLFQVPQFPENAWSFSENKFISLENLRNSEIHMCHSLGISIE